MLAPRPDHPILQKDALLGAIRDAVRRDAHAKVTELDRKLQTLEQRYDRWY